MQNTSHAVMAQRVEPHDSLDYFPTPPWATRALCNQLKTRLGVKLETMSAWEPACGEMHMADALWESFNSVYASDVHKYSECHDVSDFLFNTVRTADWIITNPPFRLAAQFARHALDRASIGVAMLCRTSFLEGQKRHEELFSMYPPSHIFQFTERVPMHKGRLVKDGSTATAYCWIVWYFQTPAPRNITRFCWIPPIRKALERLTDYS